MAYTHTTEIDFAGEDLAVTVEYDFEIGYRGQRDFYISAATGQWVKTTWEWTRLAPGGPLVRGTKSLTEKSAPFEITGTLLHMLQANDALIDELAEGWGEGSPSAYDMRREAAR